MSDSLPLLDLIPSTGIHKSDLYHQLQTLHPAITTDDFDYLLAQLIRSGLISITTITPTGTTPDPMVTLRPKTVVKLPPNSPH